MKRDLPVARWASIVAAAVAVSGVATMAAATGNPPAAEASATRLADSSWQIAADLRPGVSSFDIYESVTRLISENHGEEGIAATPTLDFGTKGETSLTVPWAGAVPDWLTSGLADIEADTGSSITIVRARNCQTDMMSIAAALHDLVPEAMRTKVTVEVGVDSLTFIGPSVPDSVLDARSGAQSGWDAFAEEAMTRTAMDSISIRFVKEATVPEPAM